MANSIHLYLTDGHESAGWNKAGTSHRVTVMARGTDDKSRDFYSFDSAVAWAADLATIAETAGCTVTSHDLTGRG